jgi:excisionase family DNA binding protein
MFVVQKRHEAIADLVKELRKEGGIMDDKKLMPDPPLATVRQAAAFLVVSTETIYRMLRKKELEPVMVREAYRIRWADLHAIVDPRPKKKAA